MGKDREQTLTVQEVSYGDGIREIGAEQSVAAQLPAPPAHSQEHSVNIITF